VMGWLESPEVRRSKDTEVRRFRGSKVQTFTNGR
jgi:hypothetical protein